jgi:hypothetical protein
MTLCLIITLIGWLFVEIFIDKKIVFIEKIGLGFLFGFILLTVPIYLLMMMGIRMNLTILIYQLVLLIIGLVIAFVFKPQKINLNLNLNLRFLNKLTIESILVISIIFFIITSFIINLYWPVSTWDSIALYDFRGKLFASGGLLVDLAKHTDNLGYYGSYPPLLSIAHGAIYLFNQNPAVLHSFFYSALVLLFYTNLKKTVNTKTALFFTLILASNSIMYIHSTLAYANLPYSTFFSIAILYFLQFLTTEKRTFLFIGTLFLAASILIRALEPFYLIPIIFLFFYSLIRRKFKIAAYSILALFTLLLTKFSWTSTHVIGTVENSIININASSFLNLSRWIEVVGFIFKSLGSYNIYLLLFVFALIYNVNYFKKHSFVPFVVISSYLFLFPGTFLLSTYYQGWNAIPDSVSRLVIFFLPLILFYTGCSISIKKSSTVKFKKVNNTR